MSSNRTHNRAFEKAKQAFFEEGKRLVFLVWDVWQAHVRKDG